MKVNSMKSDGCHKMMECQLVVREIQEHLKKSMFSEFDSLNVLVADEELTVMHSNFDVADIGVEAGGKLPLTFSVDSFKGSSFQTGDWNSYVVPFKGSKGRTIGILSFWRKNPFNDQETVKFLEFSKLVNDMAILKAESMYNHSIMDNLPVAVFAVDLQGNVMSFNDRAGQLLGFQEDMQMNIAESMEDFEHVKTLMYVESCVRRDVSIKTLKGGRKLPSVISTSYNAVMDCVEMMFVLYDGEHGQLSIKHHDLITFDELAGENEDYRELISYCRRISASNLPVMMFGEKGSGKTTLACCIHNSGLKMGSAFVICNCSEMPGFLMERKLFGENLEMGLVNAAEGGTLYIKEIENMPVKCQYRLLSMLNKLKSMDIRIIASAQHDAKELIGQGMVLKELVFRLNVLSVHVPSLRSRKDDIPQLARHFVKNICREQNKKEIQLDSDVMNILTSYSWPGNLDELKNAMETAVSTGYVSDFSCNDSSKLVEFNKAHMKLEHMEKLHIEKVLRQCEWNISKSSELLGITRNTLYAKMKKYNFLQNNC